MEIYTRASYVGFYHNMSKALREFCENPIPTHVAKCRADFAKTHYLILKESKVENIEHLRGCLNTLEKELGMEVTQ